MFKAHYFDYAPHLLDLSEKLRHTALTETRAQLFLQIPTSAGQPSISHAGQQPHSARWGQSFLFAAAVWMATRLTFLAIGVYGARFSGRAVDWIGMWIQWDANYYLSIAAHGYQPPVVVTGLESGQSNISFFPLLPLLIASIHLVVPSMRLCGLIAANLSLLGGGILLHRMAAIRFGRSAADWSVLCLMTVPGSFALSGPLSDAPFLAVSVLAASLVPVRPAAAAASSAILTISRWTGILQGMGLALDWLVDRLRHRDAPYSRLLQICLVPIPLLLFLSYMRWLTGDGLAPLHSTYHFWNQRFGVPFQSLILFFNTTQPRLEMQSGVALLLIAATLSQARAFTVGELFFVVASVASFASSDAVSPSLIRYTIGLYPVHLAIGRLCARHAPARLLSLCLAMIGAAISLFWFAGSTIYV